MKIPKIYYKDIESILYKLDFILIRQKGSHCFFRNEKNQKQLLFQNIQMKNFQETY